MDALNPVERFSTRADAYARWRPDYPAGAIDAAVEGLLGGCRIADVGAGTGISSRMIADRGAHVYAVEPNAAMRALIPPHPNIEPVDAPAETLPFDDASLDLVTVFQAFHWFDPDRFLAESHRVLRPGGRLALVWNERDDERDAFTAAYRTIVRKASGDHPAEARMDHVGPLYASSLFTDVNKLTFPHAQRLDWEGLLGRMQSTSYLPREGDAWTALVETMRELYARHAGMGGTVTLVYETRVYLAIPKR